MRNSRFSIITSITVTYLLFIQSIFAIHRGENDLPYSQKMEHPLDQAVPGFYMNLGPTGIRARIDPEHPKEFKVMYVFQDSKSPAKGLINVGDMIIGANGKKFKNPHGFHRKKAGARGWQGPPYELALAIEDSQGKDGKLDLMVKGKGKVTLQIEKKGRFSKTWPWDCPRSDKLRESLVDFLIKEGVSGRHHAQIQQILALVASGDKRAIPLLKAKAKKIMSQNDNPAQTGMCTWGWGYSGILLGEYYNITKDKAAIKKAEKLSECYEVGMDYAVGAFSHRPYPYISQRASDTGVKGYGAMAGPGGLSFLAQSTFKANGLPYSARAYQRTHEAYLLSVGNKSNASIAYGFANGWETKLIRLKDPNSPCKSGKGNGYICPTGMKDIGEFVVEDWRQTSKGKWDMKLVPSSKFPWLKSEADKLLVYEHNVYVDPSVMQRKVFRPKEVKEPTKPFNTTPGGGGHCAPMGMGAAGHFVGNKGNKSWNYLGEHLGNGCALSPGMLFDGHADAQMHGFFSVVGAAFAKKQNLRTYLDYVKTLIILSETHDGQGLVEQPFGCQRNSTCSIKRDRRRYTHVAIMLLSLPLKRLLILGADPVMGAGDMTNNPLNAILASGFMVKYCKKEIETLKKGKSPFSSTLKSLDNYARKDDDRGKEAKIMTDRMREWIAERNKELMYKSSKKPVRTMKEMAPYLKLARGLPEAKELIDRAMKVKTLSGAVSLAGVYKSIDKIKEKLNQKHKTPKAEESAKKAAKRSIEFLVPRVEQLVATEGINEEVKVEAESVLRQLKGSPDKIPDEEKIVVPETEIATNPGTKPAQHVTPTSGSDIMSELEKQINERFKKEPKKETENTAEKEPEKEPEKKPEEDPEDAKPDEEIPAFELPF